MGVAVTTETVITAEIAKTVKAVSLSCIFFCVGKHKENKVVSRTAKTAQPSRGVSPLNSTPPFLDIPILMSTKGARQSDENSGLRRCIQFCHLSGPHVFCFRLAGVAHVLVSGPCQCNPLGFHVFPCFCLFALVDISDIFNYFAVWGRQKVGSVRTGGGGRFFVENRARGAGTRVEEEGEEAVQVPQGCLQGGGGGDKYFVGGRNSHQAALHCRKSVAGVRNQLSVDGVSTGPMKRSASVAAWNESVDSGMQTASNLRSDAAICNWNPWNRIIVALKSQEVLCQDRDSTPDPNV